MGVLGRMLFLALLVCSQFFLLPADAGKKKKKKKSRTQTFEAKLRQLVKTDAQAEVLGQVCEALRPRDGDRAHAAAAQRPREHHC